MNEPLLPCPFCGSPGKRGNTLIGRYADHIYCPNEDCPVGPEAFVSELCVDAAIAWNRRALSQQPTLEPAPDFSHGTTTQKLVHWSGAVAEALQRPAVEDHAELAALEAEHFGDPIARTGVYAEDRAKNLAWAEGFNAGLGDAQELLHLLRCWAALDAGFWHVQRHAREKTDLLIQTHEAIAKATGFPEPAPTASGNDAEARSGEKREVGKPESL